jgi:hypothetical protein
VNGWCQNNHSIVAAESTTTSRNATMLVRRCAEVVMPTPEFFELLASLFDRDYIRL